MLSRQFRAVVRTAPGGSEGLAGTRILLRPPARILFAFEERTRTAWSLQRAMVLARALESELHALCVSPLNAGEESLCPERRCALAPWGALGDAAERARGWLAEALGTDGEADALYLRWGNFTEQAAVHARAIDASMIVVPAPRGAGEEVTALAHSALVPVLVARQHAAGDAIVAATDLEDCSYPVLRAATYLSRRLAMPLIALHNLSPIAVLSAIELVLSEPRSSARTLLELERSRLYQAVRELPTSATPLVAEELDPVEAILREARGGGVDLVAVGARPETWWARWLRRSVPVRVVEHVPCSVLVVPIAGGGAGGCEALALARA
ncbi:MAG TPA: universal stress protein [Polyangiaceae bacterium]|nr:universal stress protein [Polyangiaceae bacterium]